MPRLDANPGTHTDMASTDRSTHPVTREMVEATLSKARLRLQKSADDHERAVRQFKETEAGIQKLCPHDPDWLQKSLSITFDLRRCGACGKPIYKGEK